jgi:uncharacterized membrane protein
MCTCVEYIWCQSLWDLLVSSCNHTSVMYVCSICMYVCKSVSWSVSQSCRDWTFSPFIRSLQWGRCCSIHFLVHSVSLETSFFSLKNLWYIYRIFSNLIRTSFCRLLKWKKKLVRSSNPHLSFNRPLLTRQTDWIILDVTNALTVTRLMCCVWSGHLTASGTNTPQLISVATI